VEVKERRAASILFGQTIQRRDGTGLIRAEVRVACVDVERMAPVRIPDDAIPGLTP
jgi:acyl-CoA thioester hydrolase